MKTKLLITTISTLLALLATAGCNSPAEPDVEPNPSGSLIAWFNGLGYTVDLYFPGTDSLVSGAYLTGVAPNDVLYLGQDRLAVLSSLSSTLQILDLSASGTVYTQLELQQGGNPWAMAEGSGTIWITMLLTGKVTGVSMNDWSVSEQVDVSDYPYGIACASGRIFVSHGDYYPDTTSGGVSVMDGETLELQGWIDTGRNTTELWYCDDTGNIHAFSSTFMDDGAISIIDPSTSSLSNRITTGGNPVSPVSIGDCFACCDGWGSRIFFYDESGLIETWTPDSAFTLAGLAFSGDTLYMTDFGGNLVHRALWPSMEVLPDLEAGNGPQGILAVDR